MISDFAVAPLKFQFLGFPTVSGVCGVAFSKECGKRFLLFRFKPYCCSIVGCESNILVISFNFCPSLTISINFHATSISFMLDNVFQRTICTLGSIIINIVQYLQNRHTFPKLTVTQIESNVRNFLRNKLLEIGSFCKKIDALIKAERTQTKKANKVPGSLIDLSPQQIDSKACPQALLPLYSYLFSVLGSFFFGGNWIDTIII